MNDDGAARVRPERAGEPARDADGTPDDLALSAEAQRDLERWHLAAIDEAIAEDDSGEPGIPNEVVMRWLESWGKPDELPPPFPVKQR